MRWPKNYERVCAARESSASPPIAISSREWYSQSWAHGPRAIFHERVFTPDGDSLLSSLESPFLPHESRLTLSRFRRHLERALQFHSISFSRPFSVHFVLAPFSHPHRCLLSLFAIHPLSCFPLTPHFAFVQNTAMWWEIERKGGKGLRG